MDVQVGMHVEEVLVECRFRWRRYKCRWGAGGDTRGCSGGDARGWRRCWWSAGAGGGDTNAGGVQVAEVQVQVGGGAGGGGAGGGGAGGGSTR